jgi:hypothetical protein
MSLYKDQTNKLLNPFISSQIIIKDDGEEDIQINYMNIKKYFNKVYILCPLRNGKNLEDLNFKYISNKIIEEVKNYLILYQVQIDILKNKLHFDNISLVKSDFVKCFNNFGYELDDKILILPILNIKFLDLQKCYLSIFDKDYNLKDFYNMLLLGKYKFNNSIKIFTVNEHILNVIRNLEESKYFTRPWNCLLNSTKSFKKRNYQTDILKNDKIIKRNQKFEIDYLSKMFESSKYKDISNILNNRGFRLYRIPKILEFTKTDINNLFETLDNQKQKFMLYVHLLTSKYYSITFNNVFLLEKMKPIIRKYMFIFRYVFGYTWIRFMTEENFKKKRMNEDDNIVFDSELASLIPHDIPWTMENIHLNPWLCGILVGNTELQPNKNFCGIPYYYNKNLRSKGICTADQFKIRLNIFCTNNEKNDLFLNIDFAKFKMGITGSVMTACNQVKNPLESIFHGDDENIKTRLIRFYNEYYCTKGDKKSDIDIMIKTQDYFEFSKIVREIFNQLVVNILNIYSPYAEPEHVKIKPLKTLFLFVTREYIENKLNDHNQDELKDIFKKNNILKDNVDFIDIIIQNLNHECIIKMFNKEFEKLYEKNLNKIKQEINKLKEFIDKNKKEKSREEIENIMKEEFDNIYPKYSNIIQNMIDNDNFKFDKENYKDYYQMENVNYQINISDKRKIRYFNKIDFKFYDSEDLSLLVTFKYFISAPQLNHVLEIFPVNNFISTVSDFHFGCVRKYWNGSTVIQLPSSISSDLTFNSHFYRRYHSSKTNEIEIANKYRQRGFGFFCNKNEKKISIRYLSESLYWNNLYGINLNNKNSVNKILGPLKINNMLIRPRLYNCDFYNNANPIDVSDPYQDKYNNESNKYVISSHEFHIQLNKNFNCNPYNLYPLNVIDKKTGYILPIKLRDIEFYYDKITELDKFNKN